MHGKYDWMWSASSCGLTINRPNDDTPCKQDTRKADVGGVGVKRRVTFATKVTVIEIPRMTKQNLESDTEVNSEELELFVNRMFDDCLTQDEGPKRSTTTR
jgi:hypothetical protein